MRPFGVFWGWPTAALRHPDTYLRGDRETFPSIARPVLAGERPSEQGEPGRARDEPLSLTEVTLTCD
jgi:hypothetical protein